MLMILKLLVFLLASFGVQALFHEDKGNWRQIPLKSLVVRGEFFDSLGEVLIRQLWTNNEDVAITSKYKFSLDTNAVVSGFQMKIGDKSWTGVVKAKETARTQFNEAVAAGVKSSLLEKISDSEYQVEIGPIAPSETAEIEFHYLTHAKVQLDGSYRFVLPTNIARKYISGAAGKTKEELEYSNNIGATPYALQPPYLFDVDLTWHTGSALLDIASPTNAISTSIVSATEARVRCTTAPEDGDFSLSVRTEATTGAYSYESADGNTYMYVHNQIPTQVAESKSPKKITIVLDRSGSMEGAKMQEAVAAVDRFLSLLLADPTTLINVVSFGDYFDAIFSNAVPATADNIATLRATVQRFSSDYGGTELLDCLHTTVSGAAFKHTLSATPNLHTPDTEHVVLLLTDGQIVNLQRVLSMLMLKDEAVDPFRIMTIGIGRDTDRNMVEQIAKETHALCRVLVDETDLTRALSDILDYIDKQYYTNMRVLDYEVSQVASVLYPAHPVDMFLRLTPAQYQDVAAKGLIITADDPVRRGTVKAWHIPVSNVIRTGSVLEKLYADHSISELSKQIDALGHYHVAADRRAQLTASIVELSVAHGIMNKHTSFLVISDVKLEAEELVGVKKTEVPQHESTHSASPSAAPMATPSASPSAMPSGMPMASPSAVPMAIPTAVPSGMPSGMPILSGRSFSTGARMAASAAIPSAVPSVVPFAQPTVQPSFQPSTQPSAQPSRQPSGVKAAKVAHVSFRAPSVDQDGFTDSTVASPPSFTLHSVGAAGQFLDSIGQVTVQHTWSHAHVVPVVHSYNISLDARAVVTAFQVTVGGPKHAGVVRPAAAAQNAFRAALPNRGLSAVLSKVSDTVYQVQIGYLPPSVVAKIEFTYLINAASQQGGSFSLQLPNNLAPLLAPGIALAPAPPSFDVDLTWYTSCAVRGVSSALSVIDTETLDRNSVRVRCGSPPAASGDFHVTVTSAGSAGAYAYESPATGTVFFHADPARPAGKYLRLSPAGAKQVQQDGLTAVSDDALSAGTQKTWNIPSANITKIGEALEQLFFQQEIASKLASVAQDNVATVSDEVVQLSTARGILNELVSFQV